MMSHQSKPSGNVKDELFAGDGKWIIAVEIPRQTAFACPLSETSFNIFSSLTWHLKLKYPDLTVTVVHQCCDCGERFKNRKDLGNIQNCKKTHQLYGFREK